MYNHIMIRYGEIALKGKNQKDFLNRLIHNIKEQIKTRLIRGEMDEATAMELLEELGFEIEEFGENTISMVFQKGFRTGEKVIRFAMVQVAN